CVFKSTDHGMSWTQISNDLTKNDKSKQQPSGGPLTNDITSVEYYDTVFALAESPKKQGTLWAGTDDGLVHVTTDDGKNWANVTPKMPEGSTVLIIDPSPHGASSVMLLYRPQSAVRWHYPEEPDKRQPGRDIPPMAAMIDYYFKSAPKDEVTLDILDAEGKLVRHLSSKEKKENEQPPEWPD